MLAIKSQQQKTDDMNIMAEWMKQLTKNAKSLDEQLLDVVNESAKEIKTDKTEKTEDGEVKDTDEIQDPSTITKEDLKSPIDLKL